MYKELQKRVSAFLKGKGFSKKGDSFCMKRHFNWGIINFQKGRKSSEYDTVFTINLGVCSTAIAKALSGSSDENVPDIEDCHWRLRVGFLLPFNGDRWWQIDENTDINALSEEMIEVLELVVLPQIKKNISDDVLKEKWFSGVSDGATEFQRFMYLTTLLKLGQDERFDTVVAELKIFSKGKSFEYAALEHLRELEQMKNHK